MAEQQEWQHRFLAPLKQAHGVRLILGVDGEEKAIMPPHQLLISLRLGPLVTG